MVGFVGGDGGIIEKLELRIENFGSAYGGFRLCLKIYILDGGYRVFWWGGKILVKV